MAELNIYKRIRADNNIDSNLIGVYNTTKTYRVPIYFLEWLPYSGENKIKVFPDRWTAKDIFTDSPIQSVNNFYYRALNCIYLSSIKKAISSIVQIPTESFKVSRVFYENKKRSNYLRITTANGYTNTSSAIDISNNDGFNYCFNTGFIYSENNLVDISKPFNCIKGNSGLSFITGKNINVDINILEIPNVYINSTDLNNDSIAKSFEYIVGRPNVPNRPMECGVCSDFKLLEKEDIAIFLMQGIILDAGFNSNPTLPELYYSGSLRTLYYAEMEVYGRNATLTVERFIQNMNERLLNWLIGEDVGDDRD